MLKRIYRKLKWIHNISVTKYIFYNYFSSKVIRASGEHIIPYKGAVIELGKGAKIFLNGGDLSVGVNRIGNSKAETYIRIMKGAQWKCNGTVALCYGTTVDVHESATLTTGSFYMNTGSVIVVAKSVQIGKDTLIGRDNVIYDSDFHSMLGQGGLAYNKPKAVILKDHVWLTNHVMVQKGVTIEDGAVIAPFTIVKKSVQAGTLVANGMQAGCVKEHIDWAIQKPE